MTFILTRREVSRLLPETSLGARAQRVLAPGLRLVFMPGFGARSPRGGSRHQEDQQPGRALPADPEGREGPADGQRPAVLEVQHRGAARLVNRLHRYLVSVVENLSYQTGRCGCVLAASSGLISVRCWQREERLGLPMRCGHSVGAGLWSVGRCGASCRATHPPVVLLRPAVTSCTWAAEHRNVVPWVGHLGEQGVVVTHPHRS